MEKGMCDLVTVYRCLAAMENHLGAGATSRRLYRYEFNTGEHHHTTHLRIATAWRRWISASRTARADGAADGLHQRDPPPGNLRPLP